MTSGKYYDSPKDKMLIIKKVITFLRRYYLLCHWLMTEISSNKQEFILCACGCGEILEKYDKWNRERKFINGHNTGLKTGRTKHSFGYIQLYKPEYHQTNNQGYVMEHRYIYEQYHKVCLLPWIDINHINRIKTDNRIENLETKTRPEHMSLHMTKDMSNRSCLLCHAKTTYITKKGYPKWYKYKDGFICSLCYNIVK